MFDDEHNKNDIKDNSQNILTTQSKFKKLKFIDEGKANTKIEKKGSEANNDFSLKSTDNTNEKLSESQQLRSTLEDSHSTIQTYHKLKKPKIHKRRQSGWTIELRYDIMNKNLIRAIKREYKAIYEDFIVKEGLKNTKSYLIKNTELFA